MKQAIKINESQFREIIKDKINETVLLLNFEEDIRNLVFESCGISDTITKFIYDNKQTLFDLVLNSIGKGTIDKNGIEKSVSSIKLPAFVKTYTGKDGNEEEIKHAILFTIVSYNFSNKQEYLDLKDNYIINYGNSSTDGKRYDWLTIYTYTISGRLHKPSFINTLGHELSHLFKQGMAVKTIPKNDKKYLRAITDLHSTNDIEKDVAKVIYYSEKLEQEGFANGLYYQFKEANNGMPSWETFSNTDEWNVYKEVNKIIANLKQQPEQVQYILNNRYGGMKFTTLIRLAETAMRQFKKCLLKILWKCHEDLVNEGVAFRDADVYHQLIIG